MFKIPEEHDCDLLELSQKIELERVITEYVEDYVSKHRLRADLKDNIQLDKYLGIKHDIIYSKDLLRKINSDEIKIENLPWLEPHQLDPTHWQHYIDKRNLNILTTEQMATVKIFKCRKCGESKCYTYQLQIASIDEPMTTFINCKVCGNSWKV